VLVASRKEAGLTQEELGQRCGWDQARISAIETGQRGVQVAELPVLAKGLGIDSLKLFKRYLAFLAT
jgi:transcriptional regulator with XRE-family HTH domain